MTGPGRLIDLPEREVSRFGGPTVDHDSLFGNQDPSLWNGRFLIHTPREPIYRAFTGPAALVAWQVPGDMSGKIHEFDARPGGGYRMSLFCPATEEAARGKSAGRYTPLDVRPQPN